PSGIQWSSEERHARPPALPCACIPRSQELRQCRCTPRTLRDEPPSTASEATRRPLRGVLLGPAADRAPTHPRPHTASTPPTTTAASPRAPPPTPLGPHAR